MKFMAMVNTTNGDKAGPPPASLMGAIAQLGMEAGPKMLENGGMQMAAHLTLTGRNIRVDGPFSESKEVVGGYAVYELPSREAAVEWSTKFLELHKELWPEWEGEVILRQIFSYGP